ncbi:hypothetical protein WJX73_001922 [Symbiochloris irregularis]|uniref:PARG catalytic Macro domain-containing protein n=1 Tax=Symbiochloris irregularis TaxID=706552 RepID=A0AAW1PER7_9CHLO
MKELRKVTAESAAALLAEAPPVFNSGKKQQLWEYLQQSCSFSERDCLSAIRWGGPCPVETTSKLATIIEVVSDPYQYTTGLWYLNFADMNLFGFYGSDLFAQDEVMCAEIPVLMAVREALDKDALTASHTDNEATPVTITNVRHKVTVRGVYGHEFRHLPWKVIQNNLDLDDTLVNVVAAAAPRGHGLYTEKQLIDIFTTAYRAFSAAVTHHSMDNGNDKIVLHTGHWGCGAFGGNKVVMAKLQVAAAQSAGVGRLVYHAMSEGALVESAVKGVPGGKQVIEQLLLEKHQWGVSNGT